jgi:hypothetical protein
MSDRIGPLNVSLGLATVRIDTGMGIEVMVSLRGLSRRAANSARVATDIADR